MGVEGHPGEGGHGLPLAAGGDDAHLGGGQRFDVGYVHHRAGGYVHIAQLGGHPHGVFHAPAGDRNLPAILGSYVDDLLDSVDVGGEGGDDDALLTATEQCVKGRPHAALALSEAGALHVGGVAQHGQHALVAQLAQAGQVGHAPLDGGGVDLEVAGVEAHPDGGADGEGHRVGDGVVDVDELHAEPARLDRLPRLAGDELHLVAQPVLVQLQLNEAGRHPGGVDGGVHVPHEVGDGPDVILMAMGDEDGPNAVPVLDQVGEIGYDHVDAVHVVVREAHAHVHQDDVVAVLVDGEVFADLIETAKGNNFQFFCHNNSFSVKNINKLKAPCMAQQAGSNGSAQPVPRLPAYGGALP